MIVENQIPRQRVIDICEEDLYKYPGMERLPTETNYLHTQTIRENCVLHETIIEKDVYVPKEKIVEIPVEKVVQRRVPVIVDRAVPISRPIVQ